MKQPVFICKHCRKELTMPRMGMALRQAKSWFKYATCPACKRSLQIVEHTPAPVIPMVAQPPLWGEREA